MPLHSLFNHDYMYRKYRSTINIHLRRMFQLEMEKIRVGLKIQTEISINGRIQRNTAVPLVFTFLVLVFFSLFFSGLLYYCIVFYFILFYFTDFILFYSFIYLFSSLHFSFLFSSFCSSADHHLFFFFFLCSDSPFWPEPGTSSVSCLFSLWYRYFSPSPSFSPPPPLLSPSITFSPPRA